MESVFFILKEDETPTSIGGELQQFSLGGSPISFQDKASGGSQAWSVEECFAFDHAAARTPEAFLNAGYMTVHSNLLVTIHAALLKQTFRNRRTSLRKHFRDALS